MLTAVFFKKQDSNKNVLDLIIGNRIMSLFTQEALVCFVEIPVGWKVGLRFAGDEG